MTGQFTREPSFGGNTGYTGNGQQPCGLQALPINKRGGNQGNTSLYIYITNASSCCRFKKAATSCQKKYQLNQGCYRCCHVAPFFEISQGNYRGWYLFAIRTFAYLLRAGTLPPFWQAILVLPFQPPGSWPHHPHVRSR